MTENNNSIMSRVNKILRHPFVLLVTGSLILVSIAERLKNNDSFKEILIEKYYIPYTKLVSLRNTAWSNYYNNMLYDYAALQQTYKQFHKKINDQSASISRSEITEIFSKATLEIKKDSEESLKKSKKDIIDLNKELSVSMENLAVVTGQWNKYKSIQNKYNNEIDVIVKKTNALVDEKRKKIDKVIDFNNMEIFFLKFNVIRNENQRNSEEFNNFLKELKELESSTCECLEIKCNAEKEIQNIEQKKLNVMYEIFSNEIESRFNRGFLSKYLSYLL